VKGLELYTTKDMLNLPPPAWLVEDFIAEKATTMVYGPWGLGKSFMLLDMVLDGTRGETWAAADDRVFTRPLKTLYVVAEGVAFWPPRIRAFMADKGDIADENILWYPKPVQLFDGSKRGDKPPDDVLRLEETIAEHQPDLVVFDTWVRCTGAFGMEENNSGHVAQVYRELDRLRDTYGFAPVLVHHPKKDGTSGRGSGNQMASVERVIALKEMGTENRSSFVVHDEKGNHTLPFTDFIMRFENVELENDVSAVLRYDGLSGGAGGPTLSDKIYQWALTQLTPWTTKDLMLVGGVTTSNYSKALNGLIETGLINKLERGLYETS